MLHRRIAYIAPMLVVVLAAGLLCGAALAHGLTRKNARRPATSVASGLTCSASGWSLNPALSPSGSGNVFSSVSPISGTDVWAVGNEGVPQQPLAEHFDGHLWSVSTLPLGNATGGVLNGVAALATNDVWAIGTQFEPSGEPTLIEHWDGTQWNLVSSPSNGTMGSTLTGITAIAANDIWAVGFYYNDSQLDEAVLIEHWNGTAWSIVPGATTGDTNSTLNSVAAVSSTNVWAVGYGISATTSDQPLVEQWDGKVWNVVADAVSGSTARLFGVATSKSGATWAVGAVTTSSGESIPLTQQWTGSAWKVVPSTQVRGIGSGFLGVASTASGVWAVGDYVMADRPAGDTHTLIERWNGTEFYPVADATGSTQQGILYSVAAPASGAVWAVGGLGSSINPTQTLAEDFVTPMLGILCP